MSDSGRSVTSRVGGMLRRTPVLAGLPREVAVLSAIAFCVALGFGIVAPALPVFAKSFGVSAFAASAVISVFALMRFVTAPGAGWLVNRIGERVVLASGLAIVAVSSALAGLAGDYVHLLVLRGLGGIGSAMFTVSALALLLRVVDANQRGRAAGAFQAGFLFGGIAGPAVGGLVVGWSIRAPFFVYAATLALAVVVTLVFLTGARLHDREAATGSADEQLVGGAALRHALRNKAYRAALGVNLTNGFVSFGLRSALVPLFVTEALLASPSWTGVGFLIAAAVQGVLLLPAGRSADTRGRRPAMIAGTAMTLVGVVVLAFTGSIVVFLLAMALLGVSAAFLGAAPAAVLGDVTAGQRRGIVVAAYQMVSDFGAITGPLVAGLLVDSVGYGWAFGIGGVVSVFALALAVAMPETLPSKAAPVE